MKNRNLLPYAVPTFDWYLIELEQGVAASSATVSGGTNGAPYTPEVNFWEDAGSGYNKGDF